MSVNKKLVNIHNKGRKIYLFLRNREDDLQIETVNSFFPYFYAPSPEGNYKGYKGETLKKIIVSKPSQVAKNRGIDSYESDIIFTRRYLIDKVETIEKCPIKYCFIDIEVQSEEKPDVAQAKYPVSCISVYNSLTKETKTFFLPDYETEFKMIQAFIDYMKSERFDIWLSWFVKFDYTYLYNRFPDFAKELSIIGEVRYGDSEGLLYPAGISIVDYLTWFKIITQNRERQYTLDHISQRHLGKGKEYAKVDFSILSDIIRKRNRDDVDIMVRLEEKFKLIPYFDEIRRLAKVEWEDLIFNSRVVDMLLLQEAKNQNVILPMRQKDVEKEAFEGAYREAFETGAFFDVGKYDLASAYPNAIIDFCLDPANIMEESYRMRDNQGSIPQLKIEETQFAQDERALLPTVVKKLLTLKNDIKKKLSTLTTDTSEYKDTKKMYEAIKAVVNSAYGVMGNRFFRLYDKRVASATTYIVRGILHHIKDNCEKDGYKVIYVDTDSVFIQSSENLTDYLNGLIKEWYKTKYQKENSGIEFEYEGQYEKLLILTKCRYKGHIRKLNGDLEVETKGIESKRKDSTVFIKKFQTELIDKIFNKEKKEDIIEWIKLQIDSLKETPIEEISFPCKLGRPPENYKNVPIFLRALRNTEGFAKKVGEPYYYIFMQGYDESKKNLVLAFDEENKAHIDKEKIDWEQMINRNIIMKISTIFEALKWDMGEVIEIKPKKRKTRKKTTKTKKTTKKSAKKKTEEITYPPVIKSVPSKEEAKNDTNCNTKCKKISSKTLNISHEFKTQAEITDRTIMIAEAFGLGIDETKTFPIYDNFKLEVKSNDIIYIVGDSGSGKSWIVNNVFKKFPNSISFDELKIDDNEILIEGVGSDLRDALKKLNIAGLGDAFLYLRKYKQLSDGQKYRYRIAKFIDSEKDIWILDEFCATLDRTTAQIVAYNLQKIAKKLGKMVIVATTHIDLLPALKPTLVIEKGYESDVKVERFKEDFWLERLPIHQIVKFSKGTKEDYNKLKRFHYRQSQTGAIKNVYKLTHHTNVIGAIVITYPHLALKGRNIFNNKKYSKMTKENCQKINEEYECIARVVIHPTYRGIGLSQYMLKEYFKVAETKYIETVAVMANYNPFFERAGMTKIETEEDMKRKEKVEQLEQYGFNCSLISSAKYNEQVFIKLNDTQKAEVKEIVKAILNKYKGQISKLFSKNQTIDEIVESNLFTAMKELQRANIVYLIKEKENAKIL